MSDMFETSMSGSLVQRPRSAAGERHAADPFRRSNVTPRNTIAAASGRGFRDRGPAARAAGPGFGQHFFVTGSQPWVHQVGEAEKVASHRRLPSSTRQLAQLSRAVELQHADAFASTFPGLLHVEACSSPP
jgi:hypothetical protein